GPSSPAPPTPPRSRSTPMSWSPRAGGARPPLGPPGLVGLLEIIALALSASSLVMLGVLILRRAHLARRERRRREMEDALKGIAMELLHAGAEPPPLGEEERQALADLLGRYARALRGPTHDRIVDYFEREG